MRRRILLSILTVVVLSGLVLGLPLTYTAWLWVEDFTRADLQNRLGRMATEIVEQEGRGGDVVGALDTGSLRVLIPDGGKLTVIYPTPADAASRLDIGPAEVDAPLVESYSMGTSGSLRLEVPSHRMRTLQFQAVGAVILVVAASIAAGTVVAVGTARRLSDPLKYVAERAARLATGDFRTDPVRHEIAELDRVSDVLDSAALDVVDRLQRERALVADVSHQLRSRLTAVRLRLDELTAHSDPDVVEEADQAMAQVDRLTVAIDELVRSSRIDGAARATTVLVMDELEAIVQEWSPAYADCGRTLELRGDRAITAAVTGSRLREAMSVLIQNALEHGGGSTTVAVRSVASARRDAAVCVEVADEGAGVSADLAPHIFARGFSGTGSSGVGLALARALVEADGGRVELQRRTPALFAVFLPAAATAVVKAGAAEPR